MRTKLFNYKFLLVITTLCTFYFNIHAQNTYPWPSSGNIGIGTTSPGAKLHIYQSSNADASMWIQRAYNSRHCISIYKPAGTLSYTNPLWASGIYANTTDYTIWSYGTYDSKKLVIKTDGKVGIGTTAPGGKLHVSATGGSGIVLTHSNSNYWSYGIQANVDNEKTKALAVRNYTYPEGERDIFLVYGNGNVNAKSIYAEAFQVRPDAMVIWYDQVFNKDYNLMTLSELENYVKTNNHLPDIPSEREVKEEGFNMAEMDGLLLKKIEELTLYVIELEKEIEQLKQENK
ncbi:MAG: hypothetical protein JXB49_35850 [Bacteroidales bacterium]|nr:hypothetical protein [Bacteroidales bacterium]